MLKKILLAVLLVVGGVLIFAATKPDTMHIERAVTINAPAEKIFPLLVDFHRWAVWSPWEQLDPTMTKTLSGPSSGTGAVYEWSGNSDVGKGRMEILDVVEPTKVAVKLDFLEPWEGHNVATFMLEPRGEATMVTWTMDGPSPYLMKVTSVFMNLDTMIGTDFEKGLAAIKATAERP